MRSTHVGLRRETPPPAIPGAVASGGAQKVNDEPRKILNLLFFIYFFWKWAKTFNNLLFFTFR